MKLLHYLVNNTSNQPNEEQSNGQIIPAVLEAQDNTNPDRPQPKPSFK